MMYEYLNLDVYQHVRILNAGVGSWHMVQNAELIASCCILLTCSMFIYIIISFGGVSAICVFSCCTGILDCYIDMQDGTLEN